MRVFGELFRILARLIYIVICISCFTSSFKNVQMIVFFLVEVFKSLLKRGCDVLYVHKVH